MFCSQCGNKCEDTAKFCSSCGSDLKTTKQEERIACKDGCCTGSINSNGLCRTCGKSIDWKEDLSNSINQIKRIACSDGNCTGSINFEGICRTCGKPVDWKSEEEQHHRASQEPSKNNNTQKGLLFTFCIFIFGYVAYQMLNSGDTSDKTQFPQVANSQNNHVISAPKTKKPSSKSSSHNVENLSEQEEIAANLMIYGFLEKSISGFCKFFKFIVQKQQVML